MLSYRSWYIVLVLWLFSQVVRGQNMVTGFFNQIYNLELQAADSVLYLHGETSNDVVAHNFFRVNYLWWKSLTPEFSPSDEKDFRQTIQHTLDTLKDRDSLTKSEQFIELSLVAFLLRYDVARGRYMRSLGLMFSYRHKLNAMLESPYQKEFLLIKGVYNASMGYIRRTSWLYRSLLWFLPEADETLGLEQLYQSEKLGLSTTVTESKYFLYKIHKELYGNKAEAKLYIEELKKMYPKNIVFTKELKSI